MATVMDTQSSLDSFSLLLRAFGDFSGALRGWGGVFKARLKASSRRRADTFLSKVSGQSFRFLRSIEVIPGSLTARKYSPVGKCIYCGSTQYAEPPNRQFPLGKEHIIPKGLGGNLVLPLASCQTHEDITGRIVEGDILGRTLEALRVHLGLKGGKTPEVLPLTATTEGKKKESIVNVHVDDYPIMFMMPVFTPPLFEANADRKGKAVCGSPVAAIRADFNPLRRKYGITSCATAYWDSFMLCRMLAKIGHSFAVAELGSDKFAPAHLNLIRGGVPLSTSMIGCDKYWEQHISIGSTSLATVAHKLAIGYQRANGKTYVVTRVTLFANHGGPTYIVVVGQSLESPRARYRRVLSRRISSMLSR